MEIPHTVSARRDTGLFNAKIGIWLFLASEVMLFGGLFSAYVFLRVGVRDGVDFPWPNGVDVHGQLIWLGFANTLVLILSSVFVVMAWMQLKLRNYFAYQAFMVGVLCCAATFMALKTVEYNSKFNHHFGVRLADGTVLDGELVRDTAHNCPGDVVTFAAREAEFSLAAKGLLRKPDPYFLEFAQPGAAPVKLRTLEPKEESRAITGPQGEILKVTTLHFVPGTEPGREVALDQVAGVLASERKRYASLAKRHESKVRAEMGAALRKADADAVRQVIRRELESLRPAAVPAGLTGTWESPINFQFRRKNVLHGKWFADSVPFFGGNSVKGQLVDDAVNLRVHTIDLQMVRDVDKSLAWAYLGEGYRKGYERYEQEVTDHYRHWTAKGGLVPKDHLRLWKHAAPLAEQAEHGGESGSAHQEKPIAVAGKDIRFLGSHGPKFGPYYAIYFTMTGLHGLHVIGGAIVLGYFLFFGRKLYRRNPEHLANRVEVGGLFWHFVDIIWIFLFPIMYLL